MMDIEQKVTGYEVDFVTVNPDSERCGDAIACRYLLGDGTQRVMVIDGGTKESGQRLVDLIKTHYKTDYVDYVINTHPDQDHASGLTVVLENLRVGHLWMHRPWTHSEEIRHLFNDARWTDQGLANRIRDGLCAADALEDLAILKKIPISEPFQGEVIGCFIVLGPSKERYQALLPHFSGTPDAKNEPLLLKGLKGILYKAKETIYGLFEDYGHETLSETACTSHTNESSVCMFGFLQESKGCLLVGDAGVEALTEAADYAETLFKAPLSGLLSLVQVPHHGSRNNVTPAILDRLLGERLIDPSIKRGDAFVSVGGASKTHPRRVVTNAFKRRGFEVHCAGKNPLCHFDNVPQRAGYYPSVPLPIYTEVESQE